MDSHHSALDCLGGAVDALDVRVTAVARGAEGLELLRSELNNGLKTVRADASDAPLTEQTWESFSNVWNSDTKAAFLFMKAALNTPMPAGSAVVVVSSGAALRGSPLSGGYAGVILAGLRGDVKPGVTAIGVNGGAVEPLE